MGSARCPRFGCHGIGIPVSAEKKFSFGKAVVGSAVGGLLGGVEGGLIGSAMGINGKNGKTTFICSVCGKSFEAKI